MDTQRDHQSVTNTEGAIRLDISEKQREISSRMTSFFIKLKYLYSSKVFICIFYQ